MSITSQASLLIAYLIEDSSYSRYAAFVENIEVHSRNLGLRIHVLLLAKGPRTSLTSDDVLSRLGISTSYSLYNKKIEITHTIRDLIDKQGFTHICIHRSCVSPRPVYDVLGYISEIGQDISLFIPSLTSINEYPLRLRLAARCANKFYNTLFNTSFSYYYGDLVVSSELYNTFVGLGLHRLHPYSLLSYIKALGSVSYLEYPVSHEGISQSWLGSYFFDFLIALSALPIVLVRSSLLRCFRCLANYNHS